MWHAAARRRAALNKQSGRPPEVQAVNATYDLIFLTVGGNDVGFRGIVKFCLIARSRDGAHCRQSLDRALTLTHNGTVAASIRSVLSPRSNRAPTGARKSFCSAIRIPKGDRNYASPRIGHRLAAAADGTNRRIVGGRGGFCPAGS